MDKKIIEKALMRLNEYMDGYAIAELASVIVESKEAIVIECEVEHINSPDWETITRIKMGMIIGKYGTPGKALAIILPLEKEDD